MQVSSGGRDLASGVAPGPRLLLIDPPGVRRWGQAKVQRASLGHSPEL